MTSRVVHLDQKNWIELARGYYRRAPNLHKIAKNVVEKSESGQAIFPLSVTHFDETQEQRTTGNIPDEGNIFS